MKKKCIPSRDILINKYPYPIRPIIDFNCHHIKKRAKARLGVNELRQHRQSEEALPGQMQIPAGRQVQEILGRSWVYLCSFGLLWDPLGCTTLCFIKYMQDISICTSETKSCLKCRNTWILCENNWVAGGPTASKNKANLDEPSCVLHQF